MSALTRIALLAVVFIDLLGQGLVLRGLAKSSNQMHNLADCSR